MRVLLTGGTGYIGYSVARSMTAEGHRVTALTRNPGSAGGAALAGLGVRPVPGQLTDRAALTASISEVDAVVHTAYDPDDSTGGDRALFAALDAADGRKHLVYTSGCSAYGEHSHALLTPGTPLDPGNPRTRLEAELRDAGLPHTILRPGMVHGGDARSSIVGTWFREARDTGPVHRGRRDKVWSWIHVDDLARAYTAVLRDPGHHDGRSYLVADAHPVSAMAVVQAAARATGSSAALGFAPIEDENPLYRVFDRDEIIDSSATEAALEWAPREKDVVESIPRSYASWLETDQAG
ncbi:NAD(P)-dependent oxidoreductase [Amycolatopsis sp. PS_44_ISF1]|uniref:NAD-dependent epimerase/dehydratase family protein n=1 Tax=Amycolatopsis sp. PS_44_ISF1 TaxID=2974917 RepID=UPI0028DDB4CE|nr:NAD(P)-dependent oxidoreductase [Amycolatopsis sp. PS_44_ISF1]MDT8912579.1 NAD(P)-dependent oxidoreductase [Amycolatopsis sp. PS_44_ISF1]